ncbi:hypothetical protein [Amycolatopsis sp. SID8362]|uniref:hypothetical protein n=1 Tax=Amycolatopsis sp. SID8362 TaxID=2690346 RepID=UPI001EF1F3F8|nr:hypothetical protein [Amycolatopsis sp. SID8362]
MVDATTPKAEIAERVAVEADVLAGGLIVFVDQGKLSRLEYWTVEGEPPSRVPSAGRDPLRTPPLWGPKAYSVEKVSSTWPVQCLRGCTLTCASVSSFN